MSDQDDGVKNMDDTMTDDQSVVKNDQDPTGGDNAAADDGGTSSDGEGGKKSDKRVVDADRLNELLANSKELADMKAQMEDQGKNYEDRLQKAADALTGATSKGEQDEVIKQMATEWKVPQKFVKQMLDEATARASKQFDEKLQPLRLSQLDAALERELSRLADGELPEAGDFTSEERADIKKMALKKEYRGVPVIDLAKIMLHGKPKGKKKTAESSRGRSRDFGSDDVDITSMSDEEFDKFSDNLAKQD